MVDEAVMVARGTIIAMIKRDLRNILAILVLWKAVFGGKRVIGFSNLLNKIVNGYG